MANQENILESVGAACRPVPERSVVADAKTEFWRGMKDALPVVLGVLPYALVFGVQAVQMGLNPLEVAFMTGLNFAGASEFAAIRLWNSPPPILLIVAVTFLVNSRHIIMGAAFTALLQHVPKRRALLALFFMCDESWALSHADANKRRVGGQPGAVSMGYFMGAGIFIYVVWLGFTAAGACLAPLLGDIEAFGFDMAFPAVVIVLLGGMWKGSGAARPWLVSLIVAALTFRFMPGAWYVLAGALSGLGAAYLWAPAK